MKIKILKLVTIIIFMLTFASCGYVNKSVKNGTSTGVSVTDNSTLTEDSAGTINSENNLENNDAEVSSNEVLVLDHVINNNSLYFSERDAEYPLQHYQYASRSTTRPDAVIFYPNTTKEEVKYLFPIDFNYTYSEEDKAFSEINDISLYASEELYPDYFNEHRYINEGGGECVEYYPNVDSGKYRYVPYYAFEEGENIGDKNENFLPQYGDDKELSFDETILNAGFTEEELYKILTTDWDFIKRKFKFVIEPNPSGVLLRYYYRYVWRNGDISIYIDLNDERGMYIITSDGTCIDTHRGGAWAVVIE